MPTNEERKAVAARLREYIDFDFEDSNPYWYLMKAVYGDVAIHDDNELFNRLADLIEPEPERTCRWKHIEGTWFMSECGERYDRVIPDNYCPNCECKVVEE